MSWSKTDEQNLLAFKKTVDSDDVAIKEQIKKTILQDPRIIHVLNNDELDEDEPDSYYGVNILPMYMITPTQTNVQNFICFEINYDTLDRYNFTVKELEIVFYILCEQKNNYYGNTGIARHDLLAALIQDDFNYKDSLAGKLRLVSDVASVVDNSYSARTMKFQVRTDNNLVKTTNGKPSIVNQEINYLPR